MARGRFVGFPDFDMARKIGLKKGSGYLLLKVPDKEERGALGEMLLTWERDAVAQVEKGENPRDIIFYWDVAYGRMSVSKNNLIWALLTLTMRLQNEGLEEPIRRRPIDLYNEDKRAEGAMPAQTIRVAAKALPWLREVGVEVLSATPIEGTDDVLAWVVKTLSQQNDVEAHRYIEFLFNRLFLMGIPQPVEPRMKDWWLAWQMDIDKHRIELHADVLSKDQYRELHPMCEACVKAIFNGGGHLAHIRSVGAGGEEPQVAKGTEWLHLCVEDHLGVQHQKGWGEFIKKYPHLRNKVEKALEAPHTDPAREITAENRDSEQPLLFDDEDAGSPMRYREDLY